MKMELHERLIEKLPFSPNSSLSRALCLVSNTENLHEMSFSGICYQFPSSSSFLFWICKAKMSTQHKSTNIFHTMKKKRKICEPSLLEMKRSAKMNDDVDTKKRELYWATLHCSFIAIDLSCFASFLFRCNQWFSFHSSTQRAMKFQMRLQMLISIEKPFHTLFE